MKKFYLIVSIFLFACLSINAQNQLRAGLGAGIPVGDAKDFATVAVVFDMGYLFHITEGVGMGVTTGYSISFGNETEFSRNKLDDVQFLPIGGSIRFNLAKIFTFGTDLGYAIGIGERNDGGFYYAPKVQFGLSETLDIVLAYRGVSVEGGSWTLFTGGLEFVID